jgi:diguanylate cyclase (GGDEF)-like protein/PAS domain S-box-containing protein
MSLASQAGTAAGTAVAAGAAVSLWWGAARYTGPLRRAYRWFAIAAALWGAGIVTAQLLATPAADAAVPLSFGDLASLLAIPVMAAGMVRLAAAGSRAAGGETAAVGHRPAADADPAVAARAPGAPRPFAGPPRWMRGQGGTATSIADGYLLASALFLIGWVTCYRLVFLRSGLGPATFAVELIHPLADLALLGAGLPLAVRAGRRGVFPYLAVLLIAIADSMAVGARILGMPPGLAALLVQAAGLVLLGCAPWAGDGRWAGALPGRFIRGASRPGGSGGPVPTAAATAIAAAGLAAVVLVIWALTGERADRPVAGAVAGGMLAVLALRLAGQLRRANSVTGIWQESRQRFRDLADRTSDVVLLCDLAGVIRYASRAATGYGYQPETLPGTPLSGLLHPEDRAGGTRAGRRAVTDAGDRVVRFPCRVRAADGTWRHVESTVSRYTEPGGQTHLLVTARDVSAQVALRRQVTHLTFHDGLTGLPNRAYAEQRARAGAGTAAGPAPAQPAPHGVILIDLDHFTTVNAECGHSAGDVLLAQVARRLRAAVPPQDTVARWGGDEFAVLIESTASPDEVVDMAERLARGIAAPAFRAADRDVSLTASLGVAFAGRSQAGQVWRRADMAMSKAKERGGGRVEIFRAPAGPEPAGDGGARPGGPGAAGPAGNDAIPAGSNAGPAGSDAGPAGSDAGPAGNDAIPAGNDAIPAGSGIGPAADGDAKSRAASGVPGAAQAAAC